MVYHLKSIRLGTVASIILAVAIILATKLSVSLAAKRYPVDAHDNDDYEFQRPLSDYYNGRGRKFPESSIKIVRVGLIPPSKKMTKYETMLLRDAFKVIAELGDEGTGRNRKLFELASQVRYSPLVVDYVRNYLRNEDRWGSASNPSQMNIGYLTNRPPNYYDGHPEWFSFSPEDLRSIQWSKNQPLKIIVHGFSPTGLTGWDSREALQKVKDQGMFEIGDELLKQNEDLNVIIVDWTTVSSAHPFSYSRVASSVKDVAEELANFLIYLEQTVPDVVDEFWGNVHLIGFSLGGHLTGTASNRIHSRIGILLGRITGLDPAGPQFVSEECEMPLDSGNVLSPADAGYVDVIHCNMGCHDPFFAGAKGEYGTPVQSGHADFYPNGGKTQTGCDGWLTDIASCSHQKCVKLFSQSIRRRMLACPCESWELFLSQDGDCDCTRESGGVYLGEHLSGFRGETDELPGKRYYLHTD